jgi:beta-glucosidase
VAISDEARAKHHEAAKHLDRSIYKGLTMWSPNINIFRDPRWGRGHETYGEDPLLTARMGKAFCRGLQGEDDKYLKCVATVKHYAVHSGPEADRHNFDAQASIKDMRETYLPAFKECVMEAGAYSVMGAYNRTNGEPCCASHTLMDELLRGEWGFDGYYVSDCGAIDDFHLFHHVTADGAESAAMAVKGGCDLNCGTTFVKLLDAVERGLLTEEQIAVSVKRLMLARMKLGMFDPDYMVPFTKISYDQVCCEKHLELSREMARRSLVLLKNNGILPLDASRSLHNIAVIGPNANNRRALWGNYYGTASEEYTVLEGIRALRADSRIWYAQGCMHNGEAPEGSWGEEPSWGIAEAMTAASRSDAVILVLGLDERYEGEEGPTGGDKRSMALNDAQINLFEAVRSVGKPVILVMMAGSPVDMTPFEDKAAAILQAWYPGQFGGIAVAEALFGQCNPAGHLPITFYKGDQDLPDFKDYSMENRTYRFFKGQPTYPFGFGLSYTSFEYCGLKLPQEVQSGQPVAVSVKVKNTGKHAGGEVVQLYLRDNDATTRTPRWQLVDFLRVELQPGEKREVSFSLPARRLCVITDDGRTVLEPGTFTLYVGGSQPDERSVQLSGKKPLEGCFTVVGEALELEY